MALEFEFVDEGLVEALQNLPESTQRAIKDTVRATTLRGQQIVKFKTPVDSGKAINAWKTRFENNGERGVFFNDTPYINVIEFGGYPVRASSAGASLGTLRRGNAVLGGLPPGPRTQRAPGGQPQMRSNVSKQAPRGMVRSTLIELEPQFTFDLAEAIEREFV